MTVLLVLQFENEEVAKELADAYVYPGSDTAVLIGAYKKPDDYCTCQTRPTGWTRGRVYGWWVCPRCNKMSKKAIENFSSMGINLLPNEVLPKEYQHAEHSIREWEFSNGSGNSD